MRVNVVSIFRDKVTKTVYRPGDKVELTEARVAEINGAGYGMLVEPAEPPKPLLTGPEPEPKPEPEPELEPEPEPEPEPKPKQTATRGKKG